MHQLTIDDAVSSLTISGHHSFSEAHRALLDYVVTADYYLCAVQTCQAATRYQLLCLPDPDDPARTRHPRVTGTATIQKLADTAAPALSPYAAACDAGRWIAEHAGKWRHGCATDPGDRYPMAVLTTARGEAHGLLPVGALAPEAAHLAGAEHLEPTLPQILEALRHNATTTTAGCAGTPAALVAAVQHILPADVDAHQIAALVWYYALIRWGAGTP